MSDTDDRSILDDCTVLEEHEVHDPDKAHAQWDEMMEQVNLQSWLDESAVRFGRRYKPWFVLRPVYPGQCFDTRELKARLGHSADVRVNWSATLEQVIAHTCGYDSSWFAGRAIAASITDMFGRESVARQLFRVTEVVQDSVTVTITGEVP